MFTYFCWYYPGISILLFHKQTLSLGKGLYSPAWAKPTLIGGTERSGQLFRRVNSKGKSGPFRKRHYGSKYSRESACSRLSSTSTIIVSSYLSVSHFSFLDPEFSIGDCTFNFFCWSNPIYNYILGMITCSLPSR